MQCNSTKQTSWNILSLFTNSGMLFLEISLVAFLLQGNTAVESDALQRTFTISGTVAAVDMLLKVCFFCFPVISFTYKVKSMLLSFAYIQLHIHAHFAGYFCIWF